jgi:hypothetical protein
MLNVRAMKGVVRLAPMRRLTFPDQQQNVRRSGHTATANFLGRLPTFRALGVEYGLRLDPSAADALFLPLSYDSHVAVWNVFGYC